MIRKTTIAVMLAGLMLGAPGILARNSSTTKTTNTYDASSTSEDIRISCKELSADSQATPSAKRNKSDGNDAVSAVSTTIDMLTYANRRKSGRWRCRVDRGSAEGKVTRVQPPVLLTSTGDPYAFGGRCARADGTLYGTQHSGMDIGETTDGLKNDDGSLDKRQGSGGKRRKATGPADVMAPRGAPPFEAAPDVGQPRLPASKPARKPRGRD